MFSRAHRFVMENINNFSYWTSSGSIFPFPNLLNMTMYWVICYFVFGLRCGSWRGQMSTWVWRERREAARRCWWVKMHLSTPELLPCTNNSPCTNNWSSTNTCQLNCQISIYCRHKYTCRVVHVLNLSLSWLSLSALLRIFESVEKAVMFLDTSLKTFIANSHTQSIAIHFFNKCCTVE